MIFNNILKTISLLKKMFEKFYKCCQAERVVLGNEKW